MEIGVIAIGLVMRIVVPGVFLFAISDGLRAWDRQHSAFLLQG